MKKSALLVGLSIGVAVIGVKEIVQYFWPKMADDFGEVLLIAIIVGSLVGLLYGLILRRHSSKHKK